MLHQLPEPVVKVAMIFLYTLGTSGVKKVFARLKTWIDIPFKKVVRIPGLPCLPCMKWGEYVFGSRNEKVSQKSPYAGDCLPAPRWLCLRRWTLVDVHFSLVPQHFQSF